MDKEVVVYIHNGILFNHKKEQKFKKLWIDKEVVVYIPNGILLNHKKEHIWVSSDEVDEPRTYYTESSESEKER